MKKGYPNKKGLNPPSILYTLNPSKIKMIVKNIIAKLTGFLTRFHFSAIKRSSITGFSNLQVYLSIRAKLLFILKLNFYFVKNDTILVKLISYKLNELYPCKNNKPTKSV